MRYQERLCRIPPHVRYGFISIIKSGYSTRYDSQSLQRRFIRGFKKNLHPNTDSEIRSSRLNVLAQGFEKTTFFQVLDGGFKSTDARKDETLISSQKKKKEREYSIFFKPRRKKKVDEQ